MKEEKEPFLRASRSTKESSYSVPAEVSVEVENSTTTRRVLTLLALVFLPFKTQPL